MDAASARVTVAFDNFGKHREIIYSLSKDRGAWKITDIGYGDGRALRAILTGSPADRSPASR